MDYEFYKTDDFDDELSYFSHSALLCALELYEDVRKTNLFLPDIPLVEEFDLYYHMLPEGSYGWDLHSYHPTF